MQLEQGMILISAASNDSVRATLGPKDGVCLDPHQELALLRRGFKQPGEQWNHALTGDFFPLLLAHLGKKSTKTMSRAFPLE